MPTVPSNRFTVYNAFFQTLSYHAAVEAEEVARIKVSYQYIKGGKNDSFLVGNDFRSSSFCKNTNQPEHLKVSIFYARNISLTHCILVYVGRDQLSF